MENQEIESEEEIINFLNEVDKGVIGLTKPQVVFNKEPSSFEDKYPDQDNWAGSPEQAWA